MAVTSSLNSVYISPRTPRTPRVTTDYDDDDVELELLAEEERENAHRDLDQEDVIKEPESGSKSISLKDKKNMVLLSVLCE